MSDLVDRLRNRKEFFRNGGIWCMSTMPDKDCLAAASALEQAARILEAITEGPENPLSPYVWTDCKQWINTWTKNEEEE